MTRETKGELIVTALVLSALVHVGVMIYARPKVMTRVAAGVTRIAARAPMRVTKEAPRPEPVKIDAVADLAALKDAPQAETAEAAVPLPSESPDPLPSALVAAQDAPPAPPAETPAPVFDAEPIREDALVSA